MFACLDDCKREGEGGVLSISPGIFPHLWEFYNIWVCQGKRLEFFNEHFFISRGPILPLWELLTGVLLFEFVGKSLREILHGSQDVFRFPSLDVFRFPSLDVFPGVAQCILLGSQNGI